MYYVVRYRRKLVRKNLTNSFPEKTKTDIVALEKRFYRHFADVIMEIIWSYRATAAEMREHLIIENIDDIQQWALSKGGIFFLLGHLGNWEWLADIQQHYTADIQEYNVYRRLKSKSADEAMLSLRERRSGKGSGIEKNSLVRRLFDLRRSGQCYSLGLISDQKVSPKNAYYWTDFLHQDTSFLGGGEVLGKKFDKAIGYVHSTMLSRGVYSVRVEIITLDPANTSDGEITEQFARRLEQNILEQPEQWLWTHNRWKYTRTDK
jgi:KDO2-lipid IV(A) lauroyltransferase